MVIGKFRQYLSARKENADLFRIYKKYKEFTMIAGSVYVRNLQLAKIHRHIPGCVVECGVWRGGMSAGLAEVLGGDRTYILFDSFEGLPPAKDIDGAAAIAWQADKTSPGYHNNCAAERVWAEQAMAMSSARNAKLVTGWFDQTLPSYKLSEPIAILRLDGDWYDSTMVCLTHLFPYVAPGGIVILDDYYAWDGCARAVHDYLSAQKTTARLAQFRDGVPYIQVRESSACLGAS